MSVGRHWPLPSPWLNVQVLCREPQLQWVHERHVKQTPLTALPLFFYNLYYNPLRCDFIIPRTSLVSTYALLYSRYSITLPNKWANEWGKLVQTGLLVSFSLWAGKQRRWVGIHNMYPARSGIPIPSSVLAELWQSTVQSELSAALVETLCHFSDARITLSCCKVSLMTVTACCPSMSPGHACEYLSAQEISDSLLIPSVHRSSWGWEMLKGSVPVEIKHKTQA